MAQRSAHEVFAFQEHLSQSGSSSSSSSSTTRPIPSSSSSLSSSRSSSLTSLLSEVSGKFSSLKRQLSAAVKEAKESGSSDYNNDNDHESFECTNQTLEIPDLLRWIFSYLNADELCGSVSQVCREWNMESKHNLIWKPLCNGLWRGKAYVSQEFTDMVSQGLSKEAYLLSRLDSERCEVLDSELTSLTWLFRFKHEPAFLMAARLAQEQNGEELSDYTDNQIIVKFADAHHDKVVTFDTDHPWLTYRRYVWNMVDLDDDDAYMSIYSRHHLRPRRSSAKSKCSSKSWISRVTDS